MEFSPETFEPFVDVEKVAEFLSMSRREVLKLTREGRISGYPISGKQRKTFKYRLSDVEADITGILWDNSLSGSSAKAA
jgi:hypothetical protein